MLWRDIAIHQRELLREKEGNEQDAKSLIIVINGASHFFLRLLIFLPNLA